MEQSGEKGSKPKKRPPKYAAFKITVQNDGGETAKREISVEGAEPKPVDFKGLPKAKSLPLQDLDRLRTMPHLKEGEKIQVELLHFGELPKISLRNANVAKTFHSALQTLIPRHETLKNWPPADGN